MRSGHFCFLNQMDEVAAAGYDTAELHIREIMELDDAGFRAARKQTLDCGIHCEVFNNPLPMDIQINGEGFDLAYYTEFMKRGIGRIAELGGRYVNFGNGRARHIPEGTGKEEAAQRNLNVLNTLCGLAAAADLTVLLEPIGISITNYVTTITEAVDIIHQVDFPNLKALVDYRWQLAEGRPLSELADFKDSIAHIHVDYPFSVLPVRVEPTVEDGHDYKPFFDVLQEIGYSGIVSIEALTFSDFPNEIRRGIELLDLHGIV